MPFTFSTIFSLLIFFFFYSFIKLSYWALVATNFIISLWRNNVADESMENDVSIICVVIANECVVNFNINYPFPSSMVMSYECIVIQYVNAVNQVRKKNPHISHSTVKCRCWKMLFDYHISRLVACGIFMHSTKCDYIFLWLLIIEHWC